MTYIEVITKETNICFFFFGLLIHRLYIENNSNVYTSIRFHSISILPIKRTSWEKETARIRKQ